MRYALFSLLLVFPLCAQPERPTPINPLNGYSIHSLEVPQPKKVTGQKCASLHAPSDADILFNGKDTTSWNGNWKITDRILIASPGEFSTKKGYRNCQLHLEFRIPKERGVNGQKGGNSGVFFMGKYEIQIQESHTNTTYPDGQAAAVYGQYPPLVNASTPHGEWQSYDILFKAPIYHDDQHISPAQITVLHNGVAVHHAVKLIGPTSYRKVAKYPEEHPEVAPIKLQWHGDPVEFKSIWIRDLGDYSKK